MSPMNYAQACQYALGRLQSELLPQLFYHCFEHTRSDVVPATERIGQQAGLSEEELLLALTASHYHDLGWVKLRGATPADLAQRARHEELSAEMAAEILPGCGYSARQTAAVCGMIMATKLPQTPHTLAEQVVADADLDSLGRSDFFSTSIALRDELAYLGSVINEVTWFNNQLRFLRSHSYFTPAAEQLRGAGKQRNLRDIERHIAMLNTFAALMPAA